MSYSESSARCDSCGSFLSHDDIIFCSECIAELEEELEEKDEKITELEDKIKELERKEKNMT